MNWISLMFLARYKFPGGTGPSPSSVLMFIDASSSDLFCLTEATSNSSLVAVVTGGCAGAGDVVPGNVCTWPNATGPRMPNSPATASDSLLLKSSLRLSCSVMARMRLLFHSTAHATDASQGYSLAFHSRKVCQLARGR